uniref:tetraspanin-4-like isoform X1 n=1 Tax=Myxine glutinosa TaxID=7769 RepID=UPI00358F2142
MAGFCHYFLKYVLFFFNIVFWLGGCGILGVGIWLSIRHGSMSTLSPGFPLLSAANILTTIGAVTMIAGFLGCLGAIKDNRCLLLSFFILLLIILVLELVGGILFFIFKAEIEQWTRQDLLEGLQLYGREGNTGLTNAWNSLQQKFVCCGVGNHTDWFHIYGESRVPKSCCGYAATKCDPFLPPVVTRPGCYDSLHTWLGENVLYIGLGALSMLLVQVLGMAFSMSLFSHLQWEEKEYE